MSRDAAAASVAVTPSVRRVAFAVGASVRVVFLVAVGPSGRGVLRHPVGPRTLGLAGRPGRRVMPMAGRRTARAVVDASKRAGVRRRIAMGVRLWRMRERMRVRAIRAVSLTAGKPGRMRLQMAERPPRGGRRPGGRSWRDRRSLCRLARTRSGMRGRLRRRTVVNGAREVMRSVAHRSRRRGGGRRRRRRRGCRHRGDGGPQGGVRRGRGRPVLRLCAVRRRRDDDLLRRRRGEARARAGRREARCARVEEQGHRSRPEQQRSRRRSHSPGGDCEPSGAFVGRHRPLLPFPAGSPPAVAQRYKKPGRTATPRMGPTFAVSGNH